MPVDWNKDIVPDKRYLTLILIYSNIKDNKTDEMIYKLGIYVRGLEQLNKLILDLNKLQYIYNIERLMR